MKKSILKVFVVAVLVFVATMPMMGCDNVRTVFAWYEGDSDYLPQCLVMNAGETLTINSSHFSDLDIEFESFELEAREETHENVVTINGNVVTAANSGYARIIARLYQGREVIDGERVRSVWGVSVVYVHVINEETMIPITTAQELADMNSNLDGHFILMDDIDLGDFGEWTPIGNVNRPFTGMFVNPHGYVISNLTITTSKETTRHIWAIMSIVGI
ncbi:MAG: hypothetical protein FWE22_07845 [Firmicutes bacterium]|nr:hypothetical protein [Bacillota bacterium]